MIRALAKFWAKRRYVWNQEREAATTEINAKASAARAAEKRLLVAKLTAQADAIDANIKTVADAQENGFWKCEYGHEGPAPFEKGSIVDILTNKCGCGALAKFIKRETMTGQEKYESDRERREAEKMSEDYRNQAKALETDIQGHEDTVKAFTKQAAQIRNFADLLRKL